MRLDQPIARRPDRPPRAALPLSAGQGVLFKGFPWGLSKNAKARQGKQEEGMRPQRTRGSVSSS
jgi:hypothetical protein